MEIALIPIRDALRLTARWVVTEAGQLKLPRYSSSKAYEREWLRRQREAVRQAIENNRPTAEH